MEKRVQKLRLSTSAIIITIAVYALMLGVMFFCRTSIAAVGIVLVSALLLSVSALFFMPLAISMDQRAITLRFALRRKTFLRSEVVKVEPFRFRKHFIRTFGSGGFFGWWGWFHSQELGHFFAYATRLDHLLLIEMKSGEKYIVSGDCGLWGVVGTLQKTFYGRD